MTMPMRTMRARTTRAPREEGAARVGGTMEHDAREVGPCEDLSLPVSEGRDRRNDEERAMDVTVAHEPLQGEQQLTRLA